MHFVPPTLVRKGDDPVRPRNHYTRASAHLDPSQSSLFHRFCVEQKFHAAAIGKKEGRQIDGL
jgi:hypothetical protein